MRYVHNAFGVMHELDAGPLTDGDHRITWADNNRQWDPWQDKDFVAAIPAIFPEEMSPIFEEVGMKREELSQLQMALTL